MSVRVGVRSGHDEYSCCHGEVVTSINDHNYSLILLFTVETQNGFKKFRCVSGE